MRYAKRHMRDGVTHNIGDPYTGPVHTGRFLYHRGVIEPDGSAEDEPITRAHPKRQRWLDAHDSPPDQGDSSASLSWGGEE